MGGRSAAAKGATAEPPGRPPRPSHAAPAEPSEPGSEPGPGSLVPTERRPQTPTHFSPEQTRCRGPLVGSSRQQRGRELTQRRSSTSAEPVQPPGSNAGQERKKRPPSCGRGPSPATAPPTSRRTRPHLVLIGHCRPRPRPLQATPPSTAGLAQEEPDRVPGSCYWRPLASTSGLSVCEGETGKPDSQRTLLQRGFSVCPGTSATAKKSSHDYYFYPRAL